MVSKNVEVAIHSWTYILKRTRHFIFTQDELTKLNLKLKKSETPSHIFLKVHQLLTFISVAGFYL